MRVTQVKTSNVDTNSKNMTYTLYFFCRNRDLGTISVYVGYRDVRYLPPLYVHVHVHVW